MKCPRCKATITTEPDAAGVIVCPGCAARLRTRPGSAPAAPSAKAGTTKSDGPLAAATAETPAVKPPAAKSPLAKPPAAKPPTAKPPADKLPAAKPPAAKPAAPEPASADSPAVEAPAGLDALLAEIRAIRLAQEEILALLKQRPADAASGSGGGSAAPGSDDTVPPPPVVRSRRRKGVLLIDDDPQSRATAIQALEQADVPVRTVPDGNAGLAAIAEERPDVVVLELGIDGALSGKDFVNMVKATMEWVDLPIVLYTRVPIESQKEARIIHGADDLVPKGAGAAELLVSRVVALFRKA